MSFPLLCPGVVLPDDLHYGRDCARYLAEADTREAESAARWFALSELAEAEGRAIVVAPYRLDPATRRMYAAGAAIATTHTFCAACSRVMRIAEGCRCQTHCR